ncbi:MAG: hypothetical protein GMKNLPBB_00934 [Myxococcota bacterium]|nr:hypothetical protein [Myxococcota bacterium]
MNHRVRDTKTGQVMEAMVHQALQMGGYWMQTQLDVGCRPGGKRHKVDALASSPRSGQFLVSLKWQQTPGTVEQKIPFEVISLIKALNDHPEYARAYLVLGGEGWTLRDFFTGGGLTPYLHGGERVRIITLEQFIMRANRHEL